MKMATTSRSLKDNSKKGSSQIFERISSREETAISQEQYEATLAVIASVIRRGEARRRRLNEKREGERRLEKISRNVFSKKVSPFHAFPHAVMNF